jgi:hypothetical protein
MKVWVHVLCSIFTGDTVPSSKIVKLRDGLVMFNHRDAKRSL